MIEIADVTVEYTKLTGESFRAVDRASLAIEEGEFVCVVGPSGCGKTTLLKVVAGLVKPTGGTVSINGARVTGPGTDRALVFQEPRLLPWATVLRNAAYGLEVRRVPKKERELLARGMLRRIGLQGFEGSYPSELSGGMQQRVGLARALCVDPSTLLMDEPFGAVDALTRQVLQDDLLRIWSDDRKTVMFVTHAIEEAVLLSDRIVVMRAHPGEIIEVIRNELPRPRTEEVRMSPLFHDLSRHIWELLQANVRGSLEEAMEREELVTT